MHQSDAECNTDCACAHLNQERQVSLNFFPHGNLTIGCGNLLNLRQMWQESQIFLIRSRNSSWKVLLYLTKDINFFFWNMSQLSKIFRFLPLLCSIALIQSLHMQYNVWKLSKLQKHISQRNTEMSRRCVLQVYLESNNISAWISDLQAEVKHFLTMSASIYALKTLTSPIFRENLTVLVDFPSTPLKKIFCQT